ncbi:2-hydroxyacid dehydrogenase [Sphingomonas sp. MMS24-J13]|uniref:2-hydroxyacid dehydrogenase n=1 Tax=Sphingomonas sp. MMS24-J13 TaxID=3238686 RepID=UPI00384FAB0E
MVTERDEIVVIGDVPADIRAALSAEFTLQDHPLEGTAARGVADLPRDCRAIATRAVLGVPPGVIDALPNLGLVLSLGAGLDRIDQPALAARGITLAYTADQFTEDVADFALGLIYAAQRQIVAADRFARRGAWPGARFATTRRVSNRRVGIVGLGRIGNRIAGKCAALGMDVAYHSRSPRPDSEYTYHDDLAGLAQASDILVLACAASAAPRKLVTGEILSALGPEGILVNIARGSVVDEAALLDALEQGRLGGAALDVFESEPDFDPRFRALDNVVLTPHAASFTFEARRAVIDHLLAEARRFFTAARG